MNTFKLSNIPLSDFRDFLKEMECNYLRTNGGHEVWVKEGLTRPIVFQTHIDPVPEIVIKGCLSTLGKSKKDFFSYLESKSAPKSKRKAQKESD